VYSGTVQNYSLGTLRHQREWSKFTWFLAISLVIDPENLVKICLRAFESSW